RDGQLLLEPDYELEGWWTSLDEAPEAVIKRYHDRSRQGRDRQHGKFRFGSY
ncbi:hypothetical protein BDK62_1371, partial [Halomonas alkaliantarctica]